MLELVRLDKDLKLLRSVTYSTFNFPQEPVTEEKEKLTNLKHHVAISLYEMRFAHPSWLFPFQQLPE